jgi:hypothetical protein
MIHTYIILLFVVSVVSSVLTIILLRKDQIKRWYMERKDRRLKAKVREIVFEYLTELKDGSGNDKHSTKQEKDKST